MTESLKDQVVLVTGASGNVGRGAVDAFAAQGAKLALVDLNAERLSAVVNDLGGDDSRFKAFPTDLSDPDAVDTMLVNVDEQFGKIDHMVHTVGGFAMGDPIHAGNLDVFDKMMMLNARLIYLVCGRVASHMAEKGTRGSITMVLARAGKKGAKNMGAYTASKAAAIRLMESMAAEMKEYGIRVNGISPSLVDTPPNRNSMPNADFDKWVDPANIGDLMVHLATNPDMTGADVEINAWS